MWPGFGAWRGPQRELVLARDHFGKKPLYYLRAGAFLAFASELQALIQHPDVSREPDPLAIDEYLTYGYIPAPRTVYRAVQKLPPAHYLTFRQGPGESREVRVVRYWNLEYTPKRVLSEEESPAQ